VEWYDYFLYGTMAGIIFGPLFFPSSDPAVSLALSFASFALAFLVRPFGGIIFSHIGDRVGRKKTGETGRRPRRVAPIRAPSSGAARVLPVPGQAG
jgi:MFS family permease